MKQAPPIFIFEGQVVGEFTDGYPSACGRIKYMPYRGAGNIQMLKKLKDTGEVICSFKTDKRQFNMWISDNPKYRILTASDLKKEN